LIACHLAQRAGGLFDADNVFAVTGQAGDRGRFNINRGAARDIIKE